MVMLCERMETMKRLTKALISLTAAAVIALSIGAPVSAGWIKQNNGSWSYYDLSNRKATGWLQLQNTWYYLNPDGLMATGWKQTNGTWYYLSNSGAMKTGWLYTNSKWYYLNENGAMKTGWLKLQNTWYYLNGDGSMKTGWLLNNNKWYFFNSGGAMKTGWLLNGGGWYYLNGDGSMKTGWLQLGDKYYYLASDGKMVTGRQSIDGTTYVFEDNGALMPNTTSIEDATEYEQQVLKEVNQIRANAGLSPLAYSSTLSLGAKIRAGEIALKFDHVRPNGTNWYTVFAEIGQSADGTGENIARNYSTPKAVVQSWMDSSEHRKNILDPDFCYLGICYLKKTSGDEYWVQLFSNTLY